MDEAVVERLSTLNREFYATFANDFSDTRPVSRTNLDTIMPYLAGRVKMLDVGCGNGRLAGRLEQEGLQIDYTGIDVTPSLLAIARTRATRLRRVTAEFHLADLMQPDWADSVADKAPFDVVTALAVLHHIPARSERQRIIRTITSLLCPDGTLVLGNWQFDQSARLRRKIVPWSVVGLNEADVEVGDALLDWKRGGHGYRYCHLVTTTEIDSLAAGAGLAVTAQFAGDAGMNLFSVLGRQSGQLLVASR